MSLSFCTAALYCCSVVLFKQFVLVLLRNGCIYIGWSAPIGEITCLTGSNNSWISENVSWIETKPLLPDWWLLLRCSPVKEDGSMVACHLSVSLNNPRVTISACHRLLTSGSFIGMGAYVRCPALGFEFCYVATSFFPKRLRLVFASLKSKAGALRHTSHLYLLREGESRDNT